MDAKNKKWANVHAKRYPRERKRDASDKINILGFLWVGVWVWVKEGVLGV